ncbi:uncharacterized protein LOC114256868 [Camellia sinensis]|uniref:uncharacterized protein LOC114256868 n=1 Tax=Camellia sinensis TaxID=4442 RepID=UPI0010361666|nr:uncharacterized protein LOC114256868 [Camellia sinensis]
MGDTNLIGPELVLETTEKVKLIRQQLKTAQDRQRNYVDRKRRPLMFEVGSHVFLKLAGIHNVFYVSMLRKYIADPSHILKWKEISLDKDVTFKEGPVAIQDSREKNLRGKTVHLVKVLWCHRGIEESTWERQDWVKANNPELFESNR